MENERKSQTQTMIELTAEIKRHQAEKKAMHRSMRSVLNVYMYNIGMAAFGKEAILSQYLNLMSCKLRLYGILCC